MTRIFFILLTLCILIPQTSQAYTVTVDILRHSYESEDYASIYPQTARNGGLISRDSSTTSIWDQTGHESNYVDFRFRIDSDWADKPDHSIVVDYFYEMYAMSESGLPEWNGWGTGSSSFTWSSAGGSPIIQDNGVPNAGWQSHTDKIPLITGAWYNVSMATSASHSYEGYPAYGQDQPDEIRRISGQGGVGFSFEINTVDEFYELPPSATPIPGAVWLLGSGLLGLVGLQRKYQS